MADGLRKKMFDELKVELEGNRLVKFSEPKSGETVKFRGKVLYKAFRISNPWKNNGVVVYRGLTETALEVLGGKLNGGKKKWSGAPLTDKNYTEMYAMLLSVVGAGTVAKEVMLPIKRVNRPKKKRY
jgi:hypothetical protein